MEPQPVPAASRTPALRAGLSACLVLLAAASLAATIHASLTRAPWYDEFFTYYVTQPRFGWADALRDHWLTDNHPPLFYALARATTWLGEGVEPRRLLNLLIAVPAALALAALAGRAPAWRAALALFAIALFCAPITVFYGSELRSNFLAFASTAVAVAALLTVAGSWTPPPSRRANLLLWAALAVAFTTHLAATVLSGAVAIAFVSELAAARQWRRAGRLVLVCALASLPLLVTLALQFSRIEANTRDFWLPAGFNAARWAFQSEIELALRSNLALTLLAAVGLVTLLVRRTATDNACLRAVLTLALGTAIGIVVLMGLHLWRPLVINRYLVALVPPLLLALSIAAADTLRRSREPMRWAMLAGIALAGLWSIHANWQRALSEPNWGGTASQIAAIARACPGTVIHADTAWNAPVMALPPADNRAVFPMAYAMTAREYGFRVEPPGSRRMSAACPTLFWTEHVAGVEVAREHLTASLRQRGYAIGALEQRRIGRGWIVIARPE